MKDISLDCKGLPCPEPVLLTKKALDQDSPASISVLVDNEPAVENVSRFLTNNGYKVQSSQNDGEFLVQAIRTDSATQDQTDFSANDYPCPVPAPGDAKQQICVFITTDKIGLGDEELGAKLMVSFVATLKEMGQDLWRIVLVNGGVRLAVEGSPVLDSMKALTADGISILVCGTCLDFFDLLDKKQVGETTNMLDVVTSLQLASKVIKI